MFECGRPRSLALIVENIAERGRDMFECGRPSPAKINLPTCTKRPSFNVETARASMLYNFHDIISTLEKGAQWTHADIMFCTLCQVNFVRGGGP